MTAVLPIATVYKGGATHPVITFTGPKAIGDAETYVAEQPHSEDGRFTISVSDDQCPACGATFSAEAWQQGWDVVNGNRWHCPVCDAVDTRTPDAVQTVDIEPNWEGLRRWVLNVYKTDPVTARTVADAMGSGAPVLPASN